jgi:hypothetical protein
VLYLCHSCECSHVACAALHEGDTV